MTGTTVIMKGVVHGRTIELQEEVGLADGATVNVIIHPDHALSLTTEEARAAIEATAGACADAADELDEFDVTTRNLRHMDGRWINE